MVGLGLGRGRPPAADREGGERRRALGRRAPGAVPGRPIATVAADFDHLRTLGITRIYVYQPFDIAPSDWAELHAREPDIQLYAQTTLVGKAAAAKFDGIYTYDVLLWGGDSFSRYLRAGPPSGAHVPAFGRARGTTPRTRPPTSASSRAGTERPTTRCGGRPSAPAPTG